MNVAVYTDASFCHKTRLATCGFAVLEEGAIKKLQIVMMANVKSSADAEIFAAIYGLQYAFLVEGVKSINLNVDFRSIIDKSKKINRSPYRELHTTINIIGEYGVGLSLRKVKAHSDNQFNNLVDKHCNKILYQMLGHVKAKLANQLIKQTGHRPLPKFDLDPL